MNYASQSVSDQVSDQDSDQEVTKKILLFCESERSKKEICEYCGYKNLTYFTRTFLRPLVESGRLRMTVPEKPNSKTKNMSVIFNISQSGETLNTICHIFCHLHGDRNRDRTLSIEIAQQQCYTDAGLKLCLDIYQFG